MGLDAYVSCRCWQDGLATPCPVGPVGHDEDGHLTLVQPGEYDATAENAFYAWLAGDACPHPHMELVSEGVANWTGVRLFQQALRAAGEERFPTLAAALPDRNDGGFPAEQAAAVLAELDAFRASAVADEVALVDEATGQVVMQYVEACRGVFMYGPGWHAGVDPDGFFVAGDADPPVTLFRAARFTQRTLPDGRVELAAGGTRTVVAMRPVGQHRSPPPERLAVRTRSRSADDYAYLVEPLRRLCAASLATGNPVVWC
ncbi:hypothetical protein [Micromonospora humi]|uniref:Uncharacterized protein n=1 Tax=Micromonospora humi TaxID=745366 RepID=A0A1C5K7Z7_9ACTN|nr:hypothetical protein [Micromonospora humi]SCG78867.1 hypothetical protein GA0070213_12320 [Micromonospora humi]